MSHWNIKKKFSIPTFGLKTFEFKVGFKSGNRIEAFKMAPLKWLLPLFLIFLSKIIFASTLNKKDITIASHNLHAYKKSSAFHKSCIEKHGGIWMGQELWLMESQLSVMKELGVQFVARSGMENATSSGFLKGRPFGGISVAWSSDLNNIVKPLTNHRHHRVVFVELLASESPMTLASVYMPFFDTSHRDQCLLETIDTISMIDGVISEHPEHHIIIGGDLNCELTGASPFDSHWRNFMAKNNLASCDSLFRDGSDGGGGGGGGGSGIFTYHHVSLGHKKWNDHFIVSTPLVSSTKEHRIIDAGDNLSDHLPIMMSISIGTNQQPNNNDNSSNVRLPSLKWDKCSSEQKNAYSQNLGRRLTESPSLLSNCHTVHCNNVLCKTAIQSEYDTLVVQLVNADKLLPRHKPGIQKHWWTEELSALKDQCISAHRLWQAEGKPHVGASNHERLRVRALYRKAIKTVQRSPRQSSWDKLHATLASKDTDHFWKEWRKIYRKDKSHLHPVVNGVSSQRDISESFKSHFVDISKPNHVERVEQLNHEFDTKYASLCEEHGLSCNCDTYNISLEVIIDATFSLKKGKSFDDDGVSAEHFFHAPLEMYDRLQQLFTAMIRHSHVPDQFRFGTIIPIVKDHHGNLGDMHNYRGITIASVMSKIFEHVLRIVFVSFLTTSCHQFGFKKNSSTSHALFCLKETINYYTERSSNVYCSFLDASKAFDRLVHSGLFLKLLQRQVPLVFLDILIYWYSDLRCRVRWGDTCSSWFSIIAGVRQGGVLSPDLYAIYVDDLALILQRHGIGCHIRGVFLSILLFADDMALISPSLKGLQSLLKVCGDYCLTWDIYV